MSYPLRTPVAVIAIVLIKLISTTAAEVAGKDATFDRCMLIAAGLVAEMPRSDARDTALASLTWAYAHRGDVARVQFYAGQITDTYVQALTLLNVASLDWRVSRRPGHPTGVLLRATIDATAKVSNPSLRDYVYWLVGIAQAAEGRIEDTHATLELMQSADRRHSVLPSIAAAQARRGEFERAWVTALSIRPGRTREDAFQSLVFESAKSGDVAAAHGFAEHTSNKNSALSSMVRGRAEAGDFGQALELALTIADPSTRVHAFNTIAEKRSRLGQRDEARDLYRAARSIATGLAQQGAQYLFNIGTGQVHAGLVEDALATVTAFDALPEGDTGKPAHVIWLLSKIAETQATAGKREDARATLAQARQARGFSNDFTASVRLEIIRAAMAIGDVALARSVVGELRAQASGDRDPPPALLALQSIAVGLAKLGDFDAALAVVGEMDAARERDHIADAALKEMAIEQTRRGVPDMAFETVAKIADVTMRARALVEMAVAQ